MNPLIRQQFELNETTRGDWQLFAGHRRRITELLRSGAAGARRLCVLGAGNCNDLDLPALTVTFEEVVLVDLDSEALTRGTSSQPLQVIDRLRCHGSIDVTGVLERVGGWTPATRLEADDLDALAGGAGVSDWPSGAGFDVVASTCLLSQLVGSLTHALTDRHPQFLEAVKAIRTGHLRTMASLLRPGGRAVLVSDVVSSDTLPELMGATGAAENRVDLRPVAGVNVDAAAVDRLVASAIQAGNFFTGLNPVVIRGLMESGSTFNDVVFTPPWIWRCGARAYAVYAIEATRAKS